MSGDASYDGAPTASTDADRAHAPDGNLDAQYTRTDVGGLASASAVSRPLVPDGLLAELPYPLPHWEDFERLIVALATDVDDLVEVRRYGTSGQAQHGIDVIGFTRRERQPQAYQGKNVSKFDESDLTAAITKFTEGRRPFGAKRLVLAVAAPVNGTRTLERLDDAITANSDLVIELWDAVRINELLRTRPDIVRVFFGEQAVHRFCLPTDVSRTKPMVAGDIPAQLPAFQPRDSIITPLNNQGSRLTLPRPRGHRHAWRRQDAGGRRIRPAAHRGKWRLIAWVHAENGAAILDGLSQAAARLGISAVDDNHVDARHGAAALAGSRR